MFFEAFQNHHRLQEALECMDGLGFSADEKRSVFQLVAAVPRPERCHEDGSKLHAANIQLVGTYTNQSNS